jgi:hypothetical protein
MHSHWVANFLNCISSFSNRMFRKNQNGHRGLAPGFEPLFYRCGFTLEETRTAENVKKLIASSLAFEEAFK